jgi:hypothetical protein
VAVALAAVIALGVHATRAQEAAKTDEPKAGSTESAAAEKSDAATTEAKPEKEGSPPAAAKPKQSKADRQAKKAARSQMGQQDALREERALALVKEHHPELADVLANLKKHDQKAYLDAIRDLARTSDRLEDLRQRNRERYELDLEAWKLSSRIDLLAARAAMSRDPELIAKLRADVEAQIDVRIRQLELDREAFTLRLEKTDAALERLRGERERQVERNVQRLLQGIDDTRERTARAGNKNGVNKNGAKKKAADPEPAATE